MNNLGQLYCQMINDPKYPFEDILSQYYLQLQDIYILKQQQNKLHPYLNSQFPLPIIIMNIPFFLALFFSFLAAQSTITSAVQTACYSPCATCSAHPANCTSCGSTLVLVRGQCILDINDGLLVNQFFPLTQSSNSNISTSPLSDSSTFTVGACSYTENRNAVSTMSFIVPNNNLTIAYGPAVVPPHSYLNIRMVVMQRGWQTNDKLLITFNANPSIVISPGSTTNSQIICGGAPSYTATLEYAFTDTSPSFIIQLSPNFTNPQNTMYGVTSLMMRYGNCHPSCSVCFGPYRTNCTACQGYTIYNSATTSCLGCNAGFYGVNNSCYPCDPSCLTCNGGGPSMCTSCNTLFGTLVNGACQLTDANQIIQFVDFGNDDFNSSNNWTISTAASGQRIISQCGISTYLGGYSIATSNSFISKYFNLGPHFGVAIFFNLLIVDSTLTTVASNYWLDSTLYSLTLTPVSGTNQCGASIPQSLTSVSTGFQPHNNSVLYFQFRPLISSTSYYGIRNFFVIVQGCALGCATCNQTNTSQCLSCLSNYLLVNGLCKSCPVGYFNDGSKCNVCSTFCQQCFGPSINQCSSCQYPFIPKGSVCAIQQNYGMYSMYLNSANTPINSGNQWYIYPNLQTRGSTTCGQTNIFGSDQVLYKGLYMERNFTNLPQHTQLTLHMNLYQIDNYNNDTLTLKYDGVQVNYNPVTYGTNICGNSTSDAVVKVKYTVPHTASTFNIKIILNGKAKVGINNLVIFLQGCASCKNDFGFSILAIPRYSYSIPNSGIDVWINFNQNYYNSTPYDGQFKGSIGPRVQTNNQARLLQSTIPLDFDVVSAYNDVRLFAQPQGSSLNQPLNVLASMPTSITNQPFGTGIPLINNEAQFPLVRYDQLTRVGGTQRAVRNLYNLFYGFTSAILYISICSFFFGLGGAFQQFVMILQIVFIHIFILTDRMSLTLKIPLSGMKQIQFLNYFTDSVRNSIENWLLPNNFWCVSPHVFEQYQKDINWTRAIYPIVILILMYIVVYIVMRLLFVMCRPRAAIINRNPYINYFRQVYQRPVSFFDQLLRFVFITTIWACLLQFTHLTNSFVPFSGLNAWGTIMFFVIAILYPIILTWYIWRQYVYMTNQQFYYLYNDIFFKRIRNQSPEQNPHPFIYIATRFYIIFLILLVVAIPAYKYSALGSLIPLIIINVLDVAYVVCARIYTDPFCLTFKIIQNSCLVILQILMLAMYGRGRFMGQTSFYALGYACVAFIIIILINASVRLIYLIYSRVMMFLQTKYALDMTVLEQNRRNEAQKQLLRGRTRLFNNQANYVSRLGTRSNIGGQRLPTQIVQQQMIQEMQYRGPMAAPQPSINRIIY